MCPACVASAGLIAGSVVSAGGVTTLIAKILRKKKTAASKEKEKVS